MLLFRIRFAVFCLLPTGTAGLADTTFLSFPGFIDQYFFKEPLSHTAASYLFILLQRHMDNPSFRWVQGGDDLGLTILFHHVCKLEGLFSQFLLPPLPEVTDINRQSKTIRNPASNNLSQEILQTIQ